MPIVVIGLSYRTAPVEMREKLAFSDSQIPEVVNRLVSSGQIQEAVVLSTCNRVEFYLASDQTPDVQTLIRVILEGRQCPDNVEDLLYSHADPDSVKHLFRVACGLDSMVLGETEILGQLKHAYELALQKKFTGGKLNKAFQKAFNVAKQVRSETQIQKGSVSVANVAVELSEKIFSSLKQCHVLVVGAGDTGEKTAKALLSRGAGSVCVTNRTYATAQTLANELGGKAIPFESWEEVFGCVNIVISSTSAPGYILTRERLETLMTYRKNEPLLLIDIAVPRDIDPETQFIDNVYLYNIDDLQSIANDYLKQRQQEIVRCEQIIEDKAKSLYPPVPFQQQKTSATSQCAMETSD